MLRVIGLGRLSYGGSRADWLQDVEVPVVGKNTCRNQYSSYEADKKFCAGKFFF